MRREISWMGDRDPLSCLSDVHTHSDNNQLTLINDHDGDGEGGDDYHHHLLGLHFQQHIRIHNHQIHNQNNHHHHHIA